MVNQISDNFENHDKHPIKLEIIIPASTLSSIFLLLIIYFIYLIFYKKPKSMESPKNNNVNKSSSQMKDLFNKKEAESKTLPTANEMLIFFNQNKHITQKMYDSAREYYTNYVVNSRMWKATEDPSYLKQATSSHFNLLGLYYRYVGMENSGSYTNKKMVLAQNGHADPEPF